MKKRLLCLLVGFTMIFSVGGCGAKDGKESDTTSEAMEMEWTKQEEMFKSIAGTSITKIGSPQDLNDYEKQIVQEFMDRYDVTINWIPMTYNEYTEKLPQMVASGNAPDTAVMTDATSLSFMYQNLCMPLNEYIDFEDEYWDKDILDAYTIDGNCYAVNTGEIDTFFVYYNRTLFDELNLEDPYTLYENGEWTYEKMRELAKKATLYEDDNTTVSCYGIGTHAREVFILGNGGNYIKYDEAQGTYVSNLKDPATVAGLNYLRDIIADGSMNPSIQGFTEFPARKIAMFVERPMNAIANHKLLETMEDEIGIVPFPQGPNADKAYAPSIFVTNFVPTNAKNPLGGMAWNYYYLRRMMEGEEKSNEAWVARQRSMMTEEHEQIINDYLAEATKVSSILDSLVGWSSNYRETFWSDLVWNKKSAEEVSAAMENVLTKALKDTVE